MDSTMEAADEFGEMLQDYETRKPAISSQDLVNTSKTSKSPAKSPLLGTSIFISS